MNKLFEAIGAYGVQCSETKELAPPEYLLSALKEHDAGVIEEMADRFDEMFELMRKFPSTSTAESVQETLRRWAEERRKP